MRFIREYTAHENHEFERKEPQRHKVMMDFVSKWSTESIFDRETDNDDYIISIVLPHEYDYGCAICGRIKDGKLEVLDSILF